GSWVRLAITLFLQSDLSTISNSIIRPYPRRALLLCKQPYGTIVLSSLRTQWPRKLFTVWPLLPHFTAQCPLLLRSLTTKPHLMQYLCRVRGFSLEAHLLPLFTFAGTM